MDLTGKGVSSDSMLVLRRGKQGEYPSPWDWNTSQSTHPCSMRLPTTMS